MRHEPLDHFERSMRLREENPDVPHAADVDRLFRFETADRNRYQEEIGKAYPPGHWAHRSHENGRVIDLALQLIVHRAGQLPGRSSNALVTDEVCLRSVTSTDLSPYISSDRFDYIVMPTAFLHALGHYIFQLFDLAECGRDDTNTKQHLSGHPDPILAGLVHGARLDAGSFTARLLDALTPTLMRSVLHDTKFDDRFHVLGQIERILAELSALMPARSPFDRPLDAHVELPGDASATATRVARFAVVFTVCHELGHRLINAAEAQVPDETLDSVQGEILADTLGFGYLAKMHEASLLPPVVEDFNSWELLHGVCAFHSWNTSKAIVPLVVPDIPASKDVWNALHECAERLHAAKEAVEPLVADGGRHQAKTVTGPWFTPPAALLRMALRMRGSTCSIEQAIELLEHLTEAKSDLYAMLQRPLQSTPNV